jgi:flagellar hook-basal body complex protein FliE
MKPIDINPILQKPILIDSKKSNQTDESGKGFSQVLEDSINKVNALQLEADEAIKSFAKGESKDIHSTMIAVQKADISFQLMMQIRNKLVEAYQEIMRMQY